MPWQGRPLVQSHNAGAIIHGPEQQSRHRLEMAAKAEKVSIGITLSFIKAGEVGFARIGQPMAVLGIAMPLCMSER